MTRFGDFRALCEQAPSYPWCNLFYRQASNITQIYQLQLKYSRVLTLHRSSKTTQHSSLDFLPTDPLHQSASTPSVESLA